MVDSKIIELRILKLLRGFNPYNQNNIAKLIGLDPDKSTHRVQVSRGLKKLNEQGYLKKVRPGIDELGKKWGMKRDITIIEDISFQYPDILEMLRLDNTIINMVFEKHESLINEYCQGYDSHKIIEIKQEFLWTLYNSSTFFKMCLQNNSDSIDHILINLSGKTSSYIKLDCTSKHLTILKRCFSACAVADIVDGYVQPTPSEVEKMFECPFL